MAKSGLVLLLKSGAKADIAAGGETLPAALVASEDTSRAVAFDSTGLGIKLVEMAGVEPAC